MGASDSKNTNLPFIKTNLALTTNRFKIEEFIAVGFDLFQVAHESI